MNDVIEVIKAILLVAGLAVFAIGFSTVIQWIDDYKKDKPS